MAFMVRFFCRLGLRRFVKQTPVEPQFNPSEPKTSLKNVFVPRVSRASAVLAVLEHR